MPSWDFTFWVKEKVVESANYHPSRTLKWDKDRRFVISRVLKPENDRAQLSFLEGDEYEYYFFVTNTELPSEKVVISYEKRGNAENYIKEDKYDWYAPSRSDKGYGGWTSLTKIVLGKYPKEQGIRKAVFQIMMLVYNLFLLFKFDSLHISEYRQQITFRLKYVF